jgi:cytochrome c peroxidase
MDVVDAGGAVRCRSLVAGFLGFSLLFAASAAADDRLRSDAAALFGTILAPTVEEAAAPEAELGRAIFWDRRISLNGEVACASCHAADDWGSDRRRFSTDARGRLTSRQSQTVFNAIGQPFIRWTGDRRDGAHQAENSITGSMGFPDPKTAVEIMQRLGYKPAFEKAYPGDADALSPRNYGRVLQAYQATLRTPAPFDSFLAGDDSALSDRQKAGLRAFVDTGCAACHNGPLLGGTMLQRFGIFGPYQAATKSETVDEGRFAATKKEEDRFVFRVAMLRNIARTAPYFHDGSVAGLDEAVRVMAEVQLGKTLEPQLVADIVAFLDSLTGPLPQNYSAPR